MKCCLWNNRYLVSCNRLCACLTYVCSITSSHSFILHSFYSHSNVSPRHGIQGNFSAATSAADDEDDDDDDYDSDDCDDCDEEEEEEEEEENEEDDEDEGEDNDIDGEVLDIASGADSFLNISVGEKVCSHDVCVVGEKDEDEETEDNDDDEDDETDEEEEETEEEEEEDVVRVESRVEISKKGGEKDLNDDHTIHEYGVENILKVDDKHENESCDGTVIKSDNMVESNDAFRYTDVSVRLVDAECCCCSEEVKEEVKEEKGETEEVKEEKKEVKEEVEAELTEEVKEVKKEEKEEVVVDMKTEENADVDVSVNDVSQ